MDIVYSFINNKFNSRIDLLSVYCCNVDPCMSQCSLNDVATHCIVNCIDFCLAFRQLIEDGSSLANRTACGSVE